MKYYSEKTKKLYDDLSVLKNEEKEFDAKEEKKRLAQEEEKRRAAELKEKRALRTKEIEDAIKERDALDKKIDDLLKAYARDYSTIHWSRNTDTDGDTLFETFLKLF